MPASVLFCSDPLSPSVVDSYFRGQADAVLAAGAAVALIDHDELLGGDPVRAVRRIPQGIGPCWYRGWMIPADRYAELERALAARGGHLLTGAAEYRRAHELPGWYPTFASVTPQSVWMALAANEMVPPPVLAELCRPLVAAGLGGGAAVVKDFVKSRKHEWRTACYVPDVEDEAALHRVVSQFVKLQGDDLAGGVVIRAFESFVSDGPHVGEARVWWLDGRPVLIGPHPDSPEVAPRPDLAAIGPLVHALGCRFITTDIARHTDGGWRLVEVGDGQVSDLPSTVPPSIIAQELAAVS